MDNPFERYDLDPRDGIAAITQRLKELAEDATTDAERDRIRAAWEELTLHPARRLRTALFAHPETRPPLGSPPPFPRRAAGPEVPPLTFTEIALLPSVMSAFSAVPPAATEPDGRMDRALEDDPVLRRPP